MEVCNSYGIYEPQAQKFEMITFQDIVTWTMEIERQLGEENQGDGYLQDLLTEYIEIPPIQAFLQDRPAGTVQSLIHPVGWKLCDQPNTAGAVFADWAIPYDRQEEREAY